MMFLLISLPALVFAEDAPEYEYEACPLLPPEPVGSCELPVGIFYPASYNLGNSCVDLSVTGEFLYWQLNRQGFCQIGNKLRFGANQIDTTELVHHAGFRPGFKVGIGIDLLQVDDWTFNAVYTRYHHTTTNHFIALVNETIRPGLLPDVPLFTTALKSELKMHLDYFQLTVGRPFYLSQRLIVRPLIGLRVWWTKQDEKLYFDVANGPQQTIFTKNGAWGIGPYLDAEVQALLWCGTYGIGKFGLYIPYTRLNKFKENTSLPNIGLVFTEKDKSSPYITDIFAEAGIGLGWGTYLCDCNYHVDFAFTYDYMTNFIAFLLFDLGNPIVNFYTQGLSIRGQFDF